MGSLKDYSISRRLLEFSNWCWVCGSVNSPSTHVVSVLTFFFYFQRCLEMVNIDTQKLFDVFSNCESRIFFPSHVNIKSEMSPRASLILKTCLAGANFLTIDLWCVVMVLLRSTPRLHINKLRPHFDSKCARVVKSHVIFLVA